MFHSRYPRQVLIACAGAVAVSGFPVVTTAGESPADGWITHPDARSTPVVLHFRRSLELVQVPRTLPVTITADSRFVLLVNGSRMASGPSAGTAASWRYSTLDLAPRLVPGRNVIAVVVWNFGEAAPLAQTTVATGLRVTGGGISSSEPGWRVAIERGHSVIRGSEQIPWTYYVASTPEVLDAARMDWEWAGAAETAGGWREAEAAPAAARRTLIADPLPAQSFEPAPPGVVVRTSLAGGAGFPAQPVVVPANSSAKLLVRRDAVISGYPALDVSGAAARTSGSNTARRCTTRNGARPIGISSAIARS